MDNHSILGIDKTASPLQIKQAYRTLANKFHPDKGGDVKQFQEIQQAYQNLRTLTAAKKSKYRVTVALTAADIEQEVITVEVPRKKSAVYFQIPVPPAVKSGDKVKYTDQAANIEITVIFNINNQTG